MGQLPRLRSPLARSAGLKGSMPHKPWTAIQYILHSRGFATWKNFGLTRRFRREGTVRYSIASEEPKGKIMAYTGGIYRIRIL